MRHSILLGSFMAIFSTLTYSIMTAMIKIYAEVVHLPMLIFIQCFLALLFTLAFIFSQGITHAKQVMVTRNLKVQIIRTLFSLGISFFLFFAVTKIPLVNAILLANTAPLMIPFLAFFFLGQKINHQLWIPIMIGLIGITLVLHPNKDIFEPATLLALVAALCMGGSSLAVRELTKTDGTETIMFYFFLLASIISGFISLKYWIVLSNHLWFMLVIIGLLYFASQYLVSIALRYVNAQLVMTLLYANIIFSALIGVVIWHHVPTVMSLIGIIVTVASGIMCIRIEYRNNVKHL